MEITKNFIYCVEERILGITEIGFYELVVSCQFMR